MKEKSDIERLFRENYAAMYNLAARMLCDDEAAKDIVHDVFASLVASDMAKEVTPVYLMKAVRNGCYNKVRNMEIHRRIHTSYLADLSMTEAEDWPDPVVFSEIDAIIEHSLTEQCRRVIRMRYTEGRSYKEISSILGISEKSVYLHLRKGLETIQNKIKSHG